MTDIIKVIDIMPDEAKHLAQRLHRKKDEIEVHRKSLIGEIESTQEAERSIVARVSTNDRDRDGEIVEPHGIELKDFQANPVLLWAHRYDSPPVGKALWSKTDDAGLVCKFQFAQTQFAEDIYQLYKGGFLRAFSIGFIPTDYDRETKTHKKISLLEVSAVPVPANQNALVMEAYAKGIITSPSLKADLGIPSVGVPAEAETDAPAVVEELAQAGEKQEPTNGAGPVTDAVGDAPEVVEEPKAATPEVEVEKVDEESLDAAETVDMAALITDLKWEFSALRDLILERIVAAPVPAPDQPAPTVEAPPCKQAPEGSIPSAGSTPPVVAPQMFRIVPTPKSEAEELCDFVRSSEFRDVVRLEIDRAVGRVR